jgi:hypothetical protein
MHEPGASTSHMCACSATASSQTSPCRAHTHRHTSTPLTRARARAHTHTCQRHHRLDQAVGQRGLEEEGRPPSSEAVPPPACTHTRVMHRRAEGGKRGQTRGDRDTPARGTKVTTGSTSSFGRSRVLRGCSASCPTARTRASTTSATGG